MRYSRFEIIVLLVGGAAIVGSIFFSLQGAPALEEVVAQMLLIGVLAGAVHWGRKGGFAAATVASVIYIIMRIPMVIDAQGLTPEIISLLLIRILTFGLVGIVGGELCGRIKYIFTKLEDSSSIDEWSNIYNQKFVVKTLDSAIGQHTRYDTPFCVVLATIDSKLTDELRESKQRTIIGHIADHIRNDIRLVDEAGRLKDGRFVVILPHTPRDGGMIVIDRMHKGICDTLGAKEESVTIEVLAAPEDMDAINELRGQLSEDALAGSQPSVSTS